MGYNPQESLENTLNTVRVHVRERGTPNCPLRVHNKLVTVYVLYIN